MEEKLFTQSEVNAITEELFLQIKTLGARTANLALTVERANQLLLKKRDELDIIKAASESAATIEEEK